MRRPSGLLRTFVARQRSFRFHVCRLFSPRWKCRFAQDWKKVHRADDAKWAKATGLDASIIHKMWRDCLTAPDEKDDDSRIANLDLQGLAERHDVLLVTYAGEKNCLKITVFRQFSGQNSKESGRWSSLPTALVSATTISAAQCGGRRMESSPSRCRIPRYGWCDVIYTVYAYDWNGDYLPLRRTAKQRSYRGR